MKVCALRADCPSPWTAEPLVFIHVFVLVVGGDWICLRSAQQEEAVLFYRSLNRSHIRDLTQRKNNKKDDDRNKNWDLLYKHWMCPGGVPACFSHLIFLIVSLWTHPEGGFSLTCCHNHCLLCSISSAFIFHPQFLTSPSLFPLTSSQVTIATHSSICLLPRLVSTPAQHPSHSGVMDRVSDMGMCIP